MSFVDSIENWFKPDPTSSNLDKAANAAGGANQIWTPTGGSIPGWMNAANKAGDLSNTEGLNELARPFGLNYDAPAPVAPAQNGFMPSDNAFFEGAPAAEVEEAMAAEAAPFAASGGFGAMTGGLAMVGGAMQFADGASRAFGDKATEEDHWHGGLDMAAGTAGVIGGGLGLGASGLLGAGAVAACAPAAAIAAPVAAAIGLGVAGDHHAEEMNLWGTGADGKSMGTMDAAFTEGHHLGDEAQSGVQGLLGDNSFGRGAGALAGAVTEVGSDVALGAAGAVADVGLGIDALGASSGLFGTAKNDKGETYNQGAMQWMDGNAKAAGGAVDDLFGVDQNSTGGKVLGGITRGIVDVAEAPAMLAADVVGGVAGGVKAIGGWLGDLF